MATRGVTAAAIAGKALQKVGAWPPAQSAPQPHDLQRAIEAVAEVVEHKAATRRLTWLRQVYEITLQQNVEEYDLSLATNTSGACDPTIIEHWTEAWLRPTTDPQDDRRLFMTLLFEHEWSTRRGQRSVGEPTAVWIAKLRSPIAHVYPRPGLEHNGWILELTGQQEAAHLAVAQGGIAVPMPREWRLWLETEVAWQISDGTVRMLRADKREGLRSEAMKLWAEIDAFSAPEHQRQRLIEPWGRD